MAFYSITTRAHKESFSITCSLVFSYGLAYYCGILCTEHEQNEYYIGASKNQIEVKKKP